MENFDAVKTYYSILYHISKQYWIGHYRGQVGKNFDFLFSENLIVLS